jgi:hypothetical protein
MTAKNVRFQGLLAGKTGFAAGEKTLFFAIFHVFVVFGVCKWLTVRIFQRKNLSKKNRAQKPTVGFLFSGASGNIVA